MRASFGRALLDQEARTDHTTELLRSGIDLRGSYYRRRRIPVAVAQGNTASGERPAGLTILATPPSLRTSHRRCSDCRSLGPLPAVAVYRMAVAAPPYARPEIIRGEHCTRVR
jgi:hypothetical protein